MKSQLFLVGLVCVFCFLAPAKAFSQDDDISALRKNHHYQLVSKVPETDSLWELQEFIIQQEQDKKEDDVLLLAILEERMSCDNDEILQLFFFTEHSHCR